MEANRILSEDYYDNKELFPDEFEECHTWNPNRFRIAQYRVAFLCPKLSRFLKLRRKNNKTDY